MAPVLIEKKNDRENCSFGIRQFLPIIFWALSIDKGLVCSPVSNENIGLHLTAEKMPTKQFSKQAMPMPRIYSWPGLL